jgi:hypothetical protein
MKKGPRPIRHNSTTPKLPEEKLPPGWDYNRCIAEAVRDINDPRIWKGRESYLITLRDHHLRWHIERRLKESQLVPMYHILEKNKVVREKLDAEDRAARAAALTVVPPPAAAAPAPAPEPEPAAPVAAPDVPQLVVHVSTLEAARAFGLGVSQFRGLSQAPDFPPQIDRDALPHARAHRRGTRVRRTDVYAAQALQQYYDAHRAEIEALQRAATRRAALRALGPEQAQTKDEQIAELQAKIAALEAQAGMP